MECSKPVMTDDNTCFGESYAHYNRYINSLHQREVANGKMKKKGLYFYVLEFLKIIEVVLRIQ